MQSKYTVETIGDEFHEVFDNDNKQTIFASDSEIISQLYCMSKNSNANVDYPVFEEEV